jgi:hypothetical protein
MATLLQENLADAIVKNSKAPIHKRKNKKELLVSVGYKQTVAEKKPQEIIEQKGVRESLVKYGLTEGLITRALVHDIKKKPKSRVKELALGADILGMRNKDGDKGGNTFNILNVFNDERASKIARRIIGGVSTDSQSSEKSSD